MAPNIPSPRGQVDRTTSLRTPARPQRLLVSTTACRGLGSSWRGGRGKPLTFTSIDHPSAFCRRPQIASVCFHCVVCSDRVSSKADGFKTLQTLPLTPPSIERPKATAISFDSRSPTARVSRMRFKMSVSTWDSSCARTPRQMRVNRQFRQKKPPSVVRRETEWLRNVFLHRCPDLGDPGAAALGQFQLLQ